MRYLSKLILVATGFTLIGWFSGCAPVRPNPAVYGPGNENILFMLLFVVVGYLLWLNHSKSNNLYRHHKDKEDEISRINEKIKALEKDIESIKQQIKGDKNV